MKLHYVIFFLFFSLLQAQNQSPWKKITQNKTTFVARTGDSATKESLVLFALDESSLKQSLAAFNAAATATGLEVEIPNTHGDLEKFSIREFSNFEAELQAQFPDIRAYTGVGITDKAAVVHFSFSPNGIQTMVLRANGKTEFVEKQSRNQSVYNVFDTTNSTDDLALNCLTPDKILNKKATSKRLTSKTATSGVYKTLRLALACTSEYTAYFGGVPQALAAMNATLTRVNGIFNRDLAVHLNLIANNAILIYANANADPYSPADIGSEGAWGLELQQDLTAKIGNANYDIGHLLTASGKGGNAGCVGCVCQNPLDATDLAKGSGFTSPSNKKPEGDAFDVDFVAHEIGHQLGAYHTYSYEIEGTGVNVEPGSGSTIMGYAGIVDYSIQKQSDDYFAYVSIAQIQDNLATKTCPISTVLSNKTPTVNAGADYSIPKGTAFVLKGSGSDPNGDLLTYSWEQNDSAERFTEAGTNSVAYATKTEGPLFRSLKPSASPIRYMPDRANVLMNKLSSAWESVSDVSRTLHFTLTARDNAAAGLAQTDTDAMAVTVDETKGPFVITSQNTADLSWPTSSYQTINWTVNNTATLPGSANVNIKLSVDGGLTFPVVLKSNTPNDGSELVFVPANSTGKNCRILIEPTNNIYYAVNSTPFAVGYSSVSSCATYTFSTPFDIPESSSYLAKTITVPLTSAVVSDVNVAVNFTHTYISDVQIEIVSPQGKRVALFDNDCSKTKGSLLLNYDDLGEILSCDKQTTQTVVPHEPLSLLNNLNPSGVWSLQVRDKYVGDVGKINSASITICTKEYTPIAPAPVDLKEVFVSPNPSKGELNILFSSLLTSGVTVLVHDIVGKKVYEKKFPSAPLFDQTIQLNPIQAGIYFLSIIDGDTTTVKKIVIQ